jgi:hypothetical protein
VAYRKSLRTGKVGAGELDLVVAATAFNDKILVLEAVWTVIMPAKKKGTLLLAGGGEGISSGIP